MNVQYAIKNDVVYVLEVNPRASRTTPFVSKATGVPLAKVAARIMAGRSLAEQGLTEDLQVNRIFVKESVFPFLKFPGADILLGPEMKSTGEVMGISNDFGIAFAKSQQAAGFTIPTSGDVFISVNDFDKAGVLPHAKALHEMGLHVLATRGTAEYLNAHGVPAEMVYKVNEGRPNVVDHIKDGQDPHRLQHPARGRVVLRRRRHPQERRPPQRARGDHPHRHRGHGAGDPRPARAGDRRPLACRRSTPGSRPEARRP